MLMELLVQTEKEMQLLRFAEFLIIPMANE